MDHLESEHGAVHQLILEQASHLGSSTARRPRSSTARGAGSSTARPESPPSSSSLVAPPTPPPPPPARDRTTGN